MSGQAKYPSNAGFFVVHVYAQGDLYIDESVICTKSDINNLFSTPASFHFGQ